MSNLDYISERQSHLNRSTSGQWNLYASHRNALERLIVPSRRGLRICVLGAGNCNDLDLAWLTQVYREVHLVDIDARALSRGAALQKVDAAANLHRHAPIDLTGIADAMSLWPVQQPDSLAVKQCLHRLGQPPTDLVAALGGAFDVVLSPCVLSQLLTPLRDHLGEEHPGFVPLLGAIRARHLRLMVDLLSPGGAGVLATDLLSSATLPELPHIAAEKLGDVLRQRVREGRVFSGLDPDAIVTVLRNARRVEAILVAPAWLWHLSLAKTYLVHAVTFGRKE